MKIEKKAINIKNKYYKELFYSYAREGIHDVVSEMCEKWGINTILLPGYIGWSPKEGSGIFDSISTIQGITIIYYRMSKELSIDVDDLTEKIDSAKCLVFIVNYFGFRDPQIDKVVCRIKEKKAWILEDNAHGFFTYHMSKKIPSDIVIFSLHKMFTFSMGGSIIIQNPELYDMNLKGKSLKESPWNPYKYDIFSIAQQRRDNFNYLFQILQKYEKEKIIYSIKQPKDLVQNIPQTYPITICLGDRNKIYEIMNQKGYGVVSLYHTLIEPLRNKEFGEAWDLSKCILNLPIHQDVDTNEYPNLVHELIMACKISKDRNEV